MKEMFYNKTYQKSFKKSDCPEDFGTTELFVVPEAQFCSDISQSDADRKAEEYAEVEGPLYANRVGGCCKIYYSQKQEGDFYRQDCEEGYAQEEPTHYVVEAGRVWSKDSTEDANYEAIKILKAEGQAEANRSGVCKKVYYSEPQHGWFSKKCKEGWKGPEKYRTLPSGAETSFISQEDANQKAKERLLKEGQEWVDFNTRCEPVVDPCSFNFE